MWSPFRPWRSTPLGLHVCNVEGMRRALAGLRRRPGYVLTDGFPVRGLGAPALAVWKGDQVTASVAAASVVAKVTRDRMMVALDDSYPAYGFARHKGYSTPEHMTALCAYGPCPEHRYSYTNVLQANRRWATGWLGDAPDLEAGPAIEDDPAIEDGQAAQDGPAREPDEELSVADGTETPGAWADLVAGDVATADVSPAGTAWADAPHGGD